MTISNAALHLPTIPQGRAACFRIADGVESRTCFSIPSNRVLPDTACSTPENRGPTNPITMSIAADGEPATGRAVREEGCADRVEAGAGFEAEQMKRSMG